MVFKVHTIASISCARCSIACSNRPSPAPSGPTFLQDEEARPVKGHADPLESGNIQVLLLKLVTRQEPNGQRRRSDNGRSFFQLHGGEVGWKEGELQEYDALALLHHLAPQAQGQIKVELVPRLVTCSRVPGALAVMTAIR